MIELKEIKSDNYSITYDEESKTIAFQGTLRLNGTSEYASIYELLSDIVSKEPDKIVLDVKELKFLNSSGINMLSKFVINVRKSKNIHMSVIGVQAIPWQIKSLKNLQRLMPSLVLDMS